MATEYIRSEEKHKTLKDAVDEAYLGTISATTKLEQTIRYKTGPFILDYQEFQNWFSILFNLTKNESEMVRQHKDLIIKIERWQHNGSAVKSFRNINKKIVTEGIRLVHEWNSAIRSRDVIKQ